MWTSSNTFTPDLGSNGASRRRTSANGILLAGALTIRPLMISAMVPPRLAWGTGPCTTSVTVASGSPPAS